MKPTECTENYLKYIYILSSTGEVRGTMLAEALGVSRPTVSVTLKRLVKEGYIRMAYDHSVSLTPAGLTIAQKITERHLIFERLLIQLGIDKEKAHADACDMEHTVSSESFDALKKMIERVEHAAGTAASPEESVRHD